MQMPISTLFYTTHRPFSHHCSHLRPLVGSTRYFLHQGWLPTLKMGSNPTSLSPGDAVSPSFPHFRAVLFMKACIQILCIIQVPGSHTRFLIKSYYLGPAFCKHSFPRAIKMHLCLRATWSRASCFFYGYYVSRGQIPLPLRYPHSSWCSLPNWVF